MLPQTLPLAATGAARIPAAGGAGILAAVH